MVLMMGFLQQLLPHCTLNPSSAFRALYIIKFVPNKRTRRAQAQMTFSSRDILLSDEAAFANVLALMTLNVEPKQRQAT